MSYITEIKLKINLGKDTPKELVEWLNKCIEDNYYTPYEENPFFKTERWTRIFATYGYDGYDKPYIKEVKNGWELAIHTDINYESEELNTFIDWIAPHVLGRKKNVYFGWYMRDGEFEKINVYLHR
tara:strand:+ start:137 stop:514 length:378 start_codon:yes stop_codon:yes gene_type:complete